MIDHYILAQISQLFSYSLFIFEVVGCSALIKPDTLIMEYNPIIEV